MPRVGSAGRGHCSLPRGFVANNHGRLAESRISAVTSPCCRTIRGRCRSPAAVASLPEDDLGCGVTLLGHRVACAVAWNSLTLGPPISPVYWCSRTWKNPRALDDVELPVQFRHRVDVTLRKPDVLDLVLPGFANCAALPLQVNESLCARLQQCACAPVVSRRRS
jgi:hypothetical protein